MAMNWFQEMFNPQRPGPGQMAWREKHAPDWEGTGEISYGDMQEMYWKPDDMTPNPISNQGTGNSVEADQEAIRRRLLTRMQQERFQSQPDYNAATSETPQHVSVLKSYSDTPIITQPLVNTEVVEEEVVAPSIASTVVDATSGDPREKKTLEGLFLDSKELFDKGAGFLGDEDVWTGIYDDDITKLLMGGGEMVGDIGKDAYDWVSDWSSTKDMSPGYDWIGDNPAIAAGGAAALGGAGIANRMLKGRTVKPISAIPDPAPTIDADRGTGRNPSRASKFRTSLGLGAKNIGRQLIGRGTSELETKIRAAKDAARKTNSALYKPTLDAKAYKLAKERPWIARAVRNPKTWIGTGIAAALVAMVGDAEAAEIQEAAMQPGSASANAIHTAMAILEGVPGLVLDNQEGSAFATGADPFARSYGLGGTQRSQRMHDIGWAVPKPWEAQPY